MKKIILFFIILSFPLLAGTKILNDVNVNINDQTSLQLNMYLAEVLDTVTITTNTSINAETIRIETTGTTPAVNNFICLKENERFSQIEITSVSAISGNIYDIGLAMPLDYAFTTSGGCSIQNVDLSVDGSTTPVEFKISPSGLSNSDGTSYEWDITRMCISMVLTTAGDDGLFGNISTLTNGVMFRQVNGVTHNLLNVKENSDFRILSGIDLSYPTRSSGGGDYAMASRITFAGQDKRGVTVRLVASTDDKFVVTVRDDLTSIAKFRIMLQGHIVDNTPTF